MNTQSDTNTRRANAFISLQAFWLKAEYNKCSKTSSVVVNKGHQIVTNMIVFSFFYFKRYVGTSLPIYGLFRELIGPEILICNSTVI